jgi:hypothetical protein
MVQDEAGRGNRGSGEGSSEGEGEEEGGRCTIMKLFGLGLGLGTKLFPHSHTDFKNISGYEDLKEIVKRALDSEENYNLLFVGPYRWSLS